MASPMLPKRHLHSQTQVEMINRTVPGMYRSDLGVADDLLDAGAQYCAGCSRHQSEPLRQT